MKYCLLFFLLITPSLLFSQTLQLHYDFRHTLDPKNNPTNFPTIYFEYFKSKDSIGSFFIKMESDLNGTENNTGKFFMQVSQSIKFWKPKIYLQFQYTGGLGIAAPGTYGYYITNGYSVGPVCPFQWKGAWFSTSLTYVYNAFKKPSNDIGYSLYWGRGFWNYKFEFSGDVEVYTANKNTGDSYDSDLSGKRVSIFAEPQVWFKIHKGFSLGSKVNMYYHVLNTDNIMQVYPTIGARFKFN